MLFPNSHYYKIYGQLLKNDKSNWKLKQIIELKYLHSNSSLQLQIIGEITP